MEQMRKMSVDNAVFLPMVVESIESGHTATIIARGNSMRPFIEDGRDKLVFGKADVCHRVERIERGIVTMRGDGNVPCKANGTGTETFPIERVRAKLVQVIKPGKTYTLATSRTWKIYSAIWPRLLPLRRYLLALYRLLWFHQLPARWTKKD